jgi:catechol 2,3-dioxygenase-like lactoylglutathione lyase family enzyme
MLSGGVPIDHVKLPMTDIDASRAFYTAALEPFGWRLVYDDGETALGFGIGDGGEDNEPFDLLLGSVPGVRTHVAITAESPDQVQAFYEAAIAAGGTDNGPPGERPYGGYYYAAFVLDPDGHNIEAVFHKRS